MAIKVVTQSVLEDMVQRLVDAIDPDRIILFGSRARGDMHSDSDVDLLVIKPSSDPPHRRVVAAYRALAGLCVPKDILWRTPDEVEEWREVRNYVTTRAIREGKVLYEKSS
ncbi:MAG: nucleotidyltransferase domain-containing protein [Nitrospirae bacterium]|nr:nucleotidyltransferase domain-containing protein [Nitrospirota bacterium]MDA1303124.1 nucleotidyltransferase domain-containing protein [Nitrospirota bacterium]